MPTLILMRHAKSSWSGDEADHARPLSARGRRDAAAAGAQLIERGLMPNLVLCSTAVRTRQTWAQLQSAGVAADEVRYADEIYQAWIDDLIALIRDVPVGIETLMLIGHAPGLPALAADLVAPASLDADRFVTSAFAVLTTQQTWHELNSASLDGFWVP